MFSTAWCTGKNAFPGIIIPRFMIYDIFRTFFQPSYRSPRFQGRFHLFSINKYIAKTEKWNDRECLFLSIFAVFIGRFLKRFTKDFRNRVIKFCLFCWKRPDKFPHSGPRREGLKSCQKGEKFCFFYRTINFEKKNEVGLRSLFIEQPHCVITFTVLR